MVDTNLLESYLNDKVCKDGDEVLIVGESKIENKEDPITKRPYRVLNVPVKCKEMLLTYSPNKEAVEVLQKAFGHDTLNWIGKGFSVKIYPKQSFGVTKNAILPVVPEVIKI